MKNYLSFIIALFTISNCFCQYSLNEFTATSDFSGSKFGNKIDIDNNEIIVSTVSNELNNSNAKIGKVYLFNRVGSTINQSDVFCPSNTILSDEFGSALSIENGIIAIGAPKENSGFVESGSVYIYKKINDRYEFLQKLISPDANTKDYFGSYVKIIGNRLLISAIGDEDNSQDINTDTGTVFCYNFDGNGWVFSEKITSSNSLKFGEKIEAQNDKAVISCRGLDSNSNFIFNSYNWNGANWIYEATSNQFGSSQENITDFSLSDDQVFLITSNLNIKVIILTLNSTNWIQTDTITNLDFGNDQIYTKIDVDNGNMLIGSTWYILQMTRKFPALYYKKSGISWNFVTSFYGNENDGFDDYFGATLAVNGNSLIFGSNEEKAYYIDVTLDTKEFEKSPILLYPNPTGDLINLHINSNDLIKKTEVYSSIGSLINLENQNPQQISLQNLNKGIYFIIVTLNNGEEKTFKVLKE